MKIREEARGGRFMLLLFHAFHPLPRQKHQLNWKGYISWWANNNVVYYARMNQLGFTVGVRRKQGMEYVWDYQGRIYLFISSDRRPVSSRDSLWQDPFKNYYIL